MSVPSVSKKSIEMKAMDFTQPFDSLSSKGPIGISPLFISFSFFLGPQNSRGSHYEDPCWPENSGPRRAAFGILQVGLVLGVSAPLEKDVDIGPGCS